MSIAGKCCFEDTVAIFGADNILEKYDVYIGDNILPLRMESEKDLIPYYPYLESIMVSNKETGGIIRLHTRSFIDEEEEERLTWRLNELKKYWRRCKRRKEPFSTEEALKKICFFDPQDYEKKLVTRVAEFGEAAIIEGIHDPMHERMRNELYELMIKYGWPEPQAYRWVYGWERSFAREES